MSRSRSGSGKRATENKFPHLVEIPVAVGGLGYRLTEMLMWCRTEVAAGMWFQHGHSERPAARATPKVSARFYFRNETDAQAFKRRWEAKGG